MGKPDKKNEIKIPKIIFTQINLMITIQVENINNNSHKDKLTKSILEVEVYSLLCRNVNVKVALNFGSS